MFSDVITKKRRRGKRNKNKVKELAVKIIFFIFSSRNNFFINGVDFLGNSVFRTTGGKICYIRGQSRRTKKSKGTLSLMSLHLKAFLLSRRFTHIAFVFRIRFSLSRFFFFKINRTLKKKKKVNF